MAAPARLVRAAGGIVVRDGADGAPEVALVHRPRYDDWTFPKGKRAPGERDRETALREVAEETGFRCTLGPRVADVEYRDRMNRPKTVRYWIMRPVEGSFRPSDEVDEMRWLSLLEAETALSYGHDRVVLRAAVELLV
jgi:8-oxo-dGTP diphosphatase